MSMHKQQGTWCHKDGGMARFQSRLQLSIAAIRSREIDGLPAARCLRLQCIRSGWSPAWTHKVEAYFHMQNHWQISGTRMTNNTLTRSAAPNAHETEDEKAAHCLLSVHTCAVVPMQCSMQQSAKVPIRGFIAHLQLQMTEIS